MRIDAARVVEAIETWLRDTCHQQSATGVSIGLSGGIDSAVLATLAVRALGKQPVQVTYLFDRDSERKMSHRARMVADWLGLELKTKSIEPEMRKQGIYVPTGVRLTSLLGPVNRLFQRAYCRRYGETPFISLLRREDTVPPNQESSGAGLRRAILNIEAGANARHIHRRELLEQEAGDRNRLLLGAANRTEWLVGWFVKGGIDDLPNQPLQGLYKTQIRQLAAFLGVPGAVQTQAPSPDMIKGITDEFALGLRYNKIDIVLDYLEDGLTAEQVSAAGISEREIQLVREMNRLSSWKRGSGGIPPPVDGGLSGGYRAEC